jgi:hypothetical protein
MPYRLDPNTGQFVWDGSSIPQTTRDSLGTQIRELQAQIDALSFVDLDDAPTTYTGQSGKILSVKSSEDGLEFVANSSGGTVTSVSGTAPISVANGTTTPSITIATFGTSAAGVVPASGGGTTNFLRADGSWQAPPGGAGVSDGDKGDVIVSSSGTVWALDTSGVTAGSYTLASVTVDAKGRVTAASSGTVSAATISDGTTVGRNIIKLANPGAVTFLRMNADNTVTARTASETRTDLGLGGAALLAVGTTTGTVAAGDDARFHSAASVGVTLQSVMDFSGQNLYAVTTPPADRIVFFDQSEETWEYLEVGPGLSISGQTLTSTGGGGTNTILQFFPRDAEFPTTNFATIDTRNSHPVLDFPSTGSPTAIFRTYVPQGATFAGSGTALTVYIDAAATSATSGVVGWSVSLDRLVAGGQDLDSADNFGTAQSGSQTISSTSGVMCRTTVIFTQAQLPASLAAGDMFRIRIQRNNGVASNHTGDAEFVGAYLEITPSGA